MTDEAALLESLERLERDARRLRLRLLQFRHTAMLLNEKVQELAELAAEHESGQGQPD